MRATLYQALGIPNDASAEAVRAALRGQIRKYYAKTRDGYGNVEEALRFINHASRILSDPELRAQYDHDLAASDGTLEERIAHVVHRGVVANRKTIAARPRPGDRPSILASKIDSRTGEVEPTRVAHHPGLTERVASFQRSPAAAAALCTVFGVFIAGAVALASPVDAVRAAKQVMIWLTLLLLGLIVVYGVVHGIAWTQRRRTVATPALIPPADMAILNWRRQKSVFLGTNQPQEDASWVFQLRMAELERAKSGRTSEPHPWSRLGARLFDYAVWGLFLAALLSQVRAMGGNDGALFYWLGHPLVAPVLISFSWIPVEALLLATMQTTPGKWLFGVYLQFSISDAYASHDGWTQFLRAGRRAFRLWWQGLGCGMPLLAPIFIAVAYEKVADHQEAPWDFAEDCLVTHGPAGGLNTLTGVVGLAAMLWLYGVAWQQSMGESIVWARASMTTWAPSGAALWRDGMAWSIALLDRGRQGTADVPADAAPADTPPRAAASAPTHGSSANTATGSPAGVARVTATTPAPRVTDAPVASPGTPIDPEVAALFAARQKRISMLGVEGPRMLDARNYRQAADLCRTWVDLDLGNAKAWRCLGLALQGLGQHQEAIAALRKAKQYDPGDGTIDVAIDRSQRGIVNDFRSRSGG